MAVNSSQESNIAFKKLATDKATSSPNKPFFEESVSSRKAIFLKDIWSESDKIPNTATSVPNIVEKITDLTLQHIPGTNAFTHSNLKDVIPYNFGDGVSYIYKLKTSTNTSIPFGFKDWYLDPEGGVLVFLGGFSNSGSIIFNAANPPKITCYKYIGSKGELGTGGTGTPSYSQNTEVLVPTTNGQNSFTLEHTPTDVEIFTINGQEQYFDEDFQIIGNTLNWVSTDFTLDTTDKIYIKYKY